MATDVDVQFFSHLNGLTLSNNWGDMIRLLDTCLVNGLPLTAITSATVDAQGDINLTLFAAHNCLLFQIVELSGFAPSGFNGKYRIKGAPTTTTLILKAEKSGQTITTTGAAKLASLGYEIKFRDLSDVKRAYRAIDPTDAHPFIRVDESLSGEGGGTYGSTYAKSAMVGLIENMTHIDDFADTSKLQLPLDTTDFKKNWKIVGTGTSVVRGWSKWYWGKNGSNPSDAWQDAALSGFTSKQFTLAGDKDAFYLQVQAHSNSSAKTIYGAGVFDSCVPTDVIKPWFLMATLRIGGANTSFNLTNLTGAIPLGNDEPRSRFFATKYLPATPVTNHTEAQPVLPTYFSGYSNLYSSNDVAALQIPFKDADSYLRGSVPHIYYCGKSYGGVATTAVLDQNDMYVIDSYYAISGGTGNTIFYLGAM